MKKILVVCCVIFFSTSFASNCQFLAKRKHTYWRGTVQVMSPITCEYKKVDYQIYAGRKPGILRVVSRTGKSNTFLCRPRYVIGHGVCKNNKIKYSDKYVKGTLSLKKIHNRLMITGLLYGSSKVKSRVFYQLVNKSKRTA